MWRTNQRQDWARTRLEPKKKCMMHNINRTHAGRRTNGGVVLAWNHKTCREAEFWFLRTWQKLINSRLSPSKLISSGLVKTVSTPGLGLYLLIWQNGKKALIAIWKPFAIIWALHQLTMCYDLCMLKTDTTNQTLVQKYKEKQWMWISTAPGGKNWKMSSTFKQSRPAETASV